MYKAEIFLGIISARENDRTVLVIINHVTVACQIL